MKRHVLVVPPWTEDEYIASMKPAFKQKMYRRVYENYLQDGRVPSVVQPFTKIEKLKTSKYKAPRMIQARHPMFNIKFGRFIKALEHASIAHKKIGRHLGKGTTDQIAKKLQYLARKYPYYTEGDHKAFDAHVTIEQKRHLHKFYQSCFKHNAELRSLANRTIYNRCYTLHGDKWLVGGTVMSGDVDTSFGNCRINQAILDNMLFDFKIKGEVIVNGDDFVIFSEAPIPTEQAITYLLTHNMECELQPSTQIITDVSFCGSKLVISEAGEPTLLRDMRKNIDTYGMTHRIMVSRDQYLKDLATCYAYMEAHNPIGHAFATAFKIDVDPKAIPSLDTLETKLQYKMSTLAITHKSTGQITDSMYRAMPDIDDIIAIIHRLPYHVQERSNPPPLSIFIDHDHEQLVLK
uniref:RNA-directed RNA polymerase n=1 Tax=Hymenopteran tombus-related virus TaxID=2822555 RepID=A0A8A6RIK0_9TOMB|nr:RNA-dependent RNA polymerase [Hymenopteran tombus-related virus]